MRACGQYPTRNSFVKGSRKTFDGRLHGGDVEERELHGGRRHGLHEGELAERGLFAGDQEDLLVEVGRHRVAAGHATGFSQGRLELGLRARQMDKSEPRTERSAVSGTPTRLLRCAPCAALTAGCTPPRLCG